MHIHIPPSAKQTYTLIRNMNMNTCIHARVRERARALAYTRIHARARASAHTHTHTHIHTHTHMHARTHASAHEHTYARTHSRTHARTRACAHHYYLKTLTGTPAWRRPLTRPEAATISPAWSVELSVKSVKLKTNTSRYCSGLGLSLAEVAASPSEDKDSLNCLKHLLS